ncbi:MBOAT family protein [Myxococcota bacterium]|nr:MBOAT family protein [Myxococcota bacterium]
MLFNSLAFAVFFAVVFAAYALLPHRARRFWLLLASYGFYASWDWRFLGLIWVSTAVDYAVALRLAANDDAHSRRRWITLSLIVNLGILGFFKYAGFFAESLADLIAPFGHAIPDFALQVVLPVGISFYTFQSLGYTLDVYRGQLQPTRNLLDFALFVAFFPQLVAGPIERASRLLGQIATPRHLSWEGLGAGSWLILWGLFKKTVVADSLSQVVDAVYAPGAAATGPEVVLATYAFAFQIYCDFSGYTDIARGTARCLGFDLMLNFRLPYFATSPADFWRRWHISLSTWLRDYLYIPLGGNRRGSRRTLINLLLTMLLGGLWHGAAWTFVAWGAYHGALLIIQRLLQPTLDRLAPVSGTAARLWWLASILGTFHLICLGWLIFRSEDLGQVAHLLTTLFTSFEIGSTGDWWLPLGLLIAPVLAMQILQARSDDLSVQFRWPMPARAALYVALFFAIVVYGEDFGAPFIYFQF